MSPGGSSGEVPGWMTPLVSALDGVRASDLSRLSAPSGGTSRAGAVLILLGDDLGEPDKAFASRIMSGCTPQCSTAKKRPVRPRPTFTSSETSRMPCLRQSASTAGK